MAQSEMEAVANEVGKAHEGGDAVYYVLAVVLGILGGMLHVALRDPLLTALLVLSSTMFLGFMRPSRPWRWVLLVALLVPLVMIAANLLNYYRELTRAGIFGSALITLPAVAGAYGGHFGRGFMRLMFGMK
jgi:hypothetical protein